MKNEIEIARNLGFEDIPTRKKLYEEIERLRARLETAVELPCKLGDILYRIGLDENYKLKVIPRQCTQIHITLSGVELFTTTERIASDKVFMTKAEAEKRIKEIKEEK